MINALVERRKRLNKIAQLSSIPDAITNVKELISHLDPNLNVQDAIGICQQAHGLLENLEQFIQIEQQAQSNVAQTPNVTQTPVMQNTGGPVTSSNKKVYNFKKAQQIMPPMDDMGLNDAPELMGDQADMQGDVLNSPEYNANNLKFKDAADLRDRFLDVINDENKIATVRSTFLSHIQDPDKQNIFKSAIENYYADNLDLWGDHGVEEQHKLELASTIFDTLPEEFKILGPTDEGNIPATFKKVKNMENIDNTIKKMAEDFAQKITVNKQPFNLTKTAQHKTFDTSLIMYGPGQTRIDPFYRQPVSDYHIIERNKGFGLTVGDVWNIDWESIWRNTIMDKYSRAYRDKEGNWVGGYINKRFEVDYWVPETNNYQLKPGQKRKPILPEYGNTESRLEAMRAKEDRGYGPVSTGKPFNWKEADTKKKS